MKDIVLMLLTYGGSDQRRIYGERTLRSTLHHLRYSGRLLVHIADDGSPDEYRQNLHDIAIGFANVAGVSVSNSERSGYGANYNLGTQAAHTFGEIILPLEDDWVLTQDLNLDPLVEALADERIGCIRMGYLGFTRETLRGQLAHIAGGTYFLIDSANEEPHVWAGHPRLETIEWQRAVGPWPTAYVDSTPGTPGPGDTEFMVAHMPKAREGVAWPMHLARTDGADLFGHIGTVRSY